MQNEAFWSLTVSPNLCYQKESVETLQGEGNKIADTSFHRR